MPQIGLIKGFENTDFNPVKVEGFDELKRQIKKLTDSAKRREIIKIQKKVAGPLVEKAKLEAPEGPTGNLVDSIGTVTGKSKTYPNIYVAPRVARGGVLKSNKLKGGRSTNKGFHGHLVHEGTGLRRKKSGRSTGVMPSNPFLQRAFDATKSGLIRDYEEQLSKYFRKNIKKLSTK